MVRNKNDIFHCAVCTSLFRFSFFVRVCACMEIVSQFLYSVTLLQFFFAWLSHLAPLALAITK